MTMSKHDKAGEQKTWGERVVKYAAIGAVALLGLDLLIAA